MGPCRTPVVVGELDELLQRIKMKLQVRRGAFLPMPDYGSRLYLLSQTKTSNRETAARQYVSEALADEANLELSSLELKETADGNAVLYLIFKYKDKYTVSIETVI